MRASTAKDHGGDAAAPRRRDAAANHDRLLVAAAEVVRTRGHAVPLAEIAAAAGVGIGTLYRHFPDRDALLAALGDRSQQVVLDEVRRAVDRGGSPLEIVATFLERLVERRDELVLPLIGGPLAAGDTAVVRRDEIVAHLSEVVARGQADGTVRPDASALDVVVTGALLAQPFTPTLDWARAAHRHLRVYLDGLATGGPHPLGATYPTRDELEQALTPEPPTSPDAGA